MKNHKSDNDNSTKINKRIDTNDDYEYVEDFEDTANTNTDETTDGESEPEYYYYYYYDYMDSGIDISHELTTHEPLPSPLPLSDNFEQQGGESEINRETTTVKH